MNPKDSETFRVEQPLVLRKTLSEHIKHLIKDGLMLFGVDRNNWGSYRKNYYKPGQMKEYLLVSRLSGNTPADIVRYSGTERLQTWPYANPRRQVSLGGAVPDRAFAKVRVRHGAEANQRTDAAGLREAAPPFESQVA